MTNNMKTIELSDEQLAAVTGGTSVGNQTNNAEVLQSAQAESSVAILGYNDVNLNNVKITTGNNAIIQTSYIWQKNIKKSH